MGFRSITISSEAYHRLKQLKRRGESFSEVIERTVKPPLNMKKLLSDLGKLSDKTIDHVEEQVRARRRHRIKRRVA